MPFPVGLRHRYERDGFAIVSRVLRHDDIRAIQHALDLPIAILAAHDLIQVKDLRTSQRPGVTRAAAGDAVYIVGDLPKLNRILGAYIGDKRIASFVRTALGRDQIAYHYSNLTRKAARVGPRIGWHRDFPNRYICPRGSHFCRMMICLDGMDRHNSCTEFVPGSHRVSDARARRAQGRKLRTVNRGVYAMCPPGSIVIFHAKVLHRSGPNRSARNRDNLIIQWGYGHRSAFATANRELWTGLTPSSLARSAAPA